MSKTTRMALTALLLMSCQPQGSGNSFSTLQDDPAPYRLGLGLNDVSVLFPVAEVQGLQAFLPTLTQRPDPDKFAPGEPHAPLDGEPFIFANAGATIASELLKRVSFAPIFTADLSSYRLAAFRLDPCPNLLSTQGDDTQCVRSIRLSWQTEALKSFQVDRDANIHTIYALNETEFQSVLQTLRRLSQAATLDTTAMPLRPQPVIVSEGLASPYLSGVVGIVHRYARANRLIATAALAVMNANSSTWAMAQFVPKDQSLTALEVPSLETFPFTNVMSQGFEFQGRGEEMSAFPRGNSPDRMPSIPLNFGPGSSPEKIEEAKAIRLQKAYAIDNPLLHDPLTLDCGSCHQTISTLATQRKAELDGTLRIPETAFLSTRWNLSNETSEAVAKNFFSLQMFSYVNGKFKISGRVINESANVLDYLEAHKL